MDQKLTNDPHLYNHNLCWECNGKKFWGKFHAILESSTSGKPIHFYCYDKEFDNFDWSREPHQSWDVLLSARCKQLREKYDYLRLWYSGGYDSHTILMKFLELGIHIDEIFTWYSSATNTYNDITNAELMQGILPALHRLKHHPGLQNTRFRTVEMNHDTYKRFYEDPEWMFTYNTIIHEFRNVVALHMYEADPDMWRPHDQGLKVANVIGYEKPRLIKEHGRFKSFFWDSCFSNLTGTIALEPFFVTGDLPALHVKQSYMAKRWIKSKYGNPDLINAFFRADEKGYFQDEWNVHTGRIPVMHPIHRDVTGKKYDLKGAKQVTEVNKALQTPEATEIVNNWRNGVLRLQELWPHWFQNNDALNYHTHGIMSKKYDIGK